MYIKSKLFLQEKQPPQPQKKQLFCPKHLAVPRWSSCSRPSRRFGEGGTKRCGRRQLKKTLCIYIYFYIFIIIHDLFIFIFCILIITHHHHHHHHHHLHHQPQFEFRPFIPPKKWRHVLDAKSLCGSWVPPEEGKMAD